MFFRVVALKNVAIFTRKAPVSESFLIKLQELRTATLLKRCSCEIYVIFKNHLFYWTSPVAASDSFRFPACNFIKKETPAKMFICEFCKIFKNIFWQNTSGWLLLKFICEFWEVFQNSSFTEHLFFRNCSLHVQVAEFQPADTVKNYFTGAFQAIYTRTRSSHSKAFIYLKSLKIICEEVNS